ncbi:MAG: rhombosortase [Steroidobacteraceae bacterium]|mgnify:CR=1 FL=1
MPIEAVFARRRRGHPVVIIAGLVAALLVAGYPLDEGLGHALRYDRAAIRAGEWWRLATAHVAHLSWAHALLNAAALLLVLQIFRSAVRPPEWWLAGGISMLAIDVGLWWLEPQVTWYAGASGVLHGMFVAGLAGLWRGGEHRPAIALAAGLILKLAVEWWHGPVADFVAAPVVTAAHRYGAAGGLVVAVVQLLRMRRF